MQLLIVLGTITHASSHNFFTGRWQQVEKFITRIFADENLDLGYIMDVNQEMLNGYGHEVQTLRYLLNTSEMKIDGQNWFESIDINKVQKKN
ncbi:hypothetical protein SAMN06296241_2602 [Salinimicrobium sediminis]|uniref:Uncharacterized protein n=1 Tax=Salinimicrobium sediminis TaxID=1343891 RepID=A0A285X6S7_9FLAO|nr:hypothetical protein [Salinimicrobium sediminis]SOC81030.1 hypothetical protein SAMN06296241_2602 [Salinimicrobium sediminis]